jgi:hypothetical protein
LVEGEVLVKGAHVVIEGLDMPYLSHERFRPLLGLRGAPFDQIAEFPFALLLGFGDVEQEGLIESGAAEDEPLGLGVVVHNIIDIRFALWDAEDILPELEVFVEGLQVDEPHEDHGVLKDEGFLG